MSPYQNRGADGGIVAYEYGSDWIRLQFVGGKIYEYSASKIGVANLQTMKRLADAGDGLTTFVNLHPEVKNGYSR